MSIGKVLNFEHHNECEIVAFFPGLGSQSAYRDLDRSLFESNYPEVRNVYYSASEALNLSDTSERLLLSPEMIAEFHEDKQNLIAISFLVHNIALNAHFCATAEKTNTPMKISAYTGESLGMIAAAVASGSVSCKSGIQIAHAFLGLMQLENGTIDSENINSGHYSIYLESLKSRPAATFDAHHVISLKGEPGQLKDFLRRASTIYGPDDFEVHKIYSRRQINVYVRSTKKSGFYLFVKNFPGIGVFELKRPTKFLAHSAKMKDVQQGLINFILDKKIVFEDPKIPIISNCSAGIISEGSQVLNEILSIPCEIMASKETAEQIKYLNPDFVVELGLGGKSIQLLKDNEIEFSAFSYTGEKSDSIKIHSIINSVSEIKKELSVLSSYPSSINSERLNLLRKIFQISFREKLYSKLVFEYFIDQVRINVVNSERNKPDAYYRFMEIFQSTYIHRDAINISEGELVLHSRLKKQIEGNNGKVGNLNAELEIIKSNGDVYHKTVKNIDTSEVLIIHFPSIPTLGVQDLVLNLQEILSPDVLGQSVFNEIKDLLSGSVWTALVSKPEYFTIEQIAACHMAYQYGLYHALRKSRPAVFLQHDHYFEGGDICGWLLSLTAAGACSLSKAVSLYCAYILFGENSEELGLAQQFATSLKAAEVPIIAFNGTPLQSRKDLEIFARSILSGEWNSTQPICLNGNCQVISIGAKPTQNWRVTSFHEVSVCSLENIRQIRDKDGASPIHMLEIDSIGRLTIDNEKVMNYARSRRLLSSVVNAYMNSGERVVGFGKGGSESMTVFFTKELSA